MILVEKRRVQLLRQQLSALSQKKIMSSPKEYFNERRLSLSFSQERMIAAARENVGRKRKSFIGKAATLDAISPLKVLSRGYGFVTKRRKNRQDSGRHRPWRSDRPAFAGRQRQLSGGTGGPEIGERVEKVSEVTFFEFLGAVCTPLAHPCPLIGAKSHAQVAAFCGFIGVGRTTLFVI